MTNNLNAHHQIQEAIDHVERAAQLVEHFALPHAVQLLHEIADDIAEQVDSIKTHREFIKSLHDLFGPAGMRVQRGKK